MSIHVRYELKADEQYKEAASQAVMDSQEKYCGVSSMLKKAIPVTWEIEFNGKVNFDNKPVETKLLTGQFV